MPKKEKTKPVVEPVLSEKEKEQLKQESYDKYVSVYNNLTCMSPTVSKIDMLIHLQEEFEKFGEYNDAVSLARACKELIKDVKDDVKRFNYKDSERRLNEAKSEEEFEQIKQTYVDMGDYLDAKQYIKQCDDQLKKIRRRDKFQTLKKTGILFIILLLLISTKTKLVRYNAAKCFRKVTCYERSAKIFKELKSYKDSKKRYTEVTYQQAKYLYDKGKIAEARDAFYEVHAYKDSAKRLVAIENTLLMEAEVGQVVAIGNNKYLLLQKEDNSVMLMRNKGLPKLTYSNDLKDVTWENSTIREYLNNNYINDSFCKEEVEHIITSKINNTPNATYNTNGGNDTEDKVYLLSQQEMGNYIDLISQKSRKISWLRTPGAIQSAASVYGMKQVNDYGYVVNSDCVSAYPVLWYQVQYR